MARTPDGEMTTADPLRRARATRPSQTFARQRQREATRWPLGLFGAIAMVVGVEAWVARNHLAFSDPVAFSWRFGVETADKAEGVDVLCLGDSLAKHGLVPSLIGPVLGQRASNLAAAAAPAPLTYFALKRALDAGARPSAVVLEYKPSVLAGGPKLRARYWPEALSAPELVDLAQTTRSAPFAAELFIGALLPSFRSRNDIRENVLAALRGETSRVEALNSICRRNWTVNAGANVAARQPGFTGEVSELSHKALLSDKFAVNRVNASYLRRTIELARSRGITTYVLVPPFAPELIARRAATGVEDRYSAFLRSLQERYPGLRALDARGSGYPASAFVDASHLDGQGAVTLSLDVAEAIRADRDAGAPSKGRWVMLPDFRERPGLAGLEDVEQSRERLGIRWTP